MRSRNRRLNESYSDINSSNAWDAYDTAIEYLGADGLCEALAKAMGTDELASNLEYIFRMYEIPFGDDDEEFDESMRRAKSAKRHKRVTENYYDSWKETPFSLFYDGEKHTLSKYTKDQFSDHPKMVIPQYNRQTDTLYYIGFIDGEDVGEKFINSSEAMDYLDHYYRYEEFDESLRRPRSVGRIRKRR